MLIRVGVKFCGSCNPHIDTGELFRRINAETVQLRIGAGKGEMREGEPRRREIIFTSPDTPGLDALLILSGCPHDCAARPPGPVLPEVAVAGETVNRAPCPSPAIPACVTQILQTLLPG